MGEIGDEGSDVLFTPTLRRVKEQLEVEMSRNRSIVITLVPVIVC